MRPSSFALVVLFLLPAAAVAQNAQAPVRQAPSLSLSTGGGAGLPRLGIWKPLSPRFALGLEVEGAWQSSMFFPDGHASGAVSRRDWRLTLGPAATLRLATLGPLSLLAYGGVSYGVHAFDVAEHLDDRGGPTKRGVGLRGGIGLDWSASDHWTLGVLYQGRWASAPGYVGEVARDAWLRPGLGVAVRFRF